MKTFKLWISLCLIFSISFFTNSQTVDIDGTLQKWHKVTISLTLPGNGLTETGNTFKNSRMDVVFTRPDGSVLRVPGFFAADGNAANTNATEGSIFKAYLRPDQLGVWSYEVLYYTGNNVATNTISSLPSPTYSLTGDVGDIEPSDKTLPDLRAKGKLEYQKTGSINQRRYLRFAETGEYFLKFGPDSPENFLDYNDFDFDDSREDCPLCVQHFYDPHLGDFNTGDPTWDGGKGKNIIGAINYMSEIGQVNAISMSLYGGDDINVFPWTKVGSRFIYDVSKLEQWEIVLNYAEQKGLHLHFKLAEAENWYRLNTLEINTYYREMVARFGHHLGVEWNISEEYGSTGSAGTAASAIPRINFLDAIDPWNSLIVIHTRPELEYKKKYDSFLAQTPKTKLTGASMQNDNDGRNYPEVFELTKDLITKSRENNTPWVVASDEQAPANNGVFTSNSETNSNVSQNARKGVLWGNLMAGGAGVMWYGGSRGDFRTEDFRRYETLDTWARHAILTFFQGSGVAYWNTDNDDRLVSGRGNRCLADAGQAYIIYLPNGGTTNLDLSNQSGDFDVKWFDPRNGGALQDGGVTSISGGASRSLGSAPNNSTSDWAILVTAQVGTDPVSGVTLAPDILTLAPNQTKVLTATVLPSTAADKSVTWSSDDISVATVDSDGVVTAVAEGSAVITVTTTDGGFTANSEITVSGSAPQTVILSPINDAYLERATNFNNNVLKIQQEGINRTAYLMFDLSGINGTISSAELKMTCNGDGSNNPMNITVDKGDSNNWTESTLSSSNKPTIEDELGSINGTWSIGTRYTWSLDETKLSGGNNLSLIVSSASGGSDTWFASDENSVAGPELVVTYIASAARILQPSKNVLANEQAFIAMYPNPLYKQDLKINLAKDSDSYVKIYGIGGQLIAKKELVRGELILSNRLFESKGMYFIHVQSGDAYKIMKLVVR